jgi:hypothetical protein
MLMEVDFGFAAKHDGQGGLWSCVVVEVSGEGVFGGWMVVDGGGGNGVWVVGSGIVDGVRDVGGECVGGSAGYAVGGVGGVVWVDVQCL